LQVELFGVLEGLLSLVRETYLTSILKKIQIYFQTTRNSRFSG